MHCCEGCLQVRTTGPAVRKRAIYGANQRARTSSRQQLLDVVSGLPTITLGIIRLDWRMAVMRQLDRCPHGVGTSKPVDGEDHLAKWAAIDKAYPRSSHSRFPSTPDISRAMPTDDLVDQFFAEPSGKRARAQ